jgi:hypothetical protein
MYNEWKPKAGASGGGFVRAHHNPLILNECHRDERNKDVLRNGNLIVPTSYFFGFVLREDLDPERVIIGMSSTQLKKARLWLNMALSIKVPGPNGTKITPPLFSHKYALAATPEGNELGSWMGWHIETLGPVKKLSLIQSCADVAKQISSGAQKMLGNAAPKEEEDEDNVPV